MATAGRTDHPAPARLTVDDPAAPPKHAQLRTILTRLLDEELHTGDLIPSERVLAERFGVSRMTVRQAVEQLVVRGRLRRVPGKGTFVAARTIVLPLQLRSFSAEMRERGLLPGAAVLGFTTRAAEPHVAAALDLHTDARVHVFERLRTADGEPVALERSHVVASVVPGLRGEDLVDRSLYALLADEYGVHLDRGEQTVEATAATAAVARLLGIRAGAPVLTLVRRSYAGDVPVEYVESRYRGDRYRLQTPLS